MGKLTDLFRQYAAVDIIHGTDKDTSHSYGPIYEKLFEGRKDSAKEVLEIGVYSGASCLVWATYFPNAHIDGVDITLSRVRFGKGHQRITYHERDGTTAETAATLGKKYDIIIDDGSHEPDHQIKSLDVFAPYLAKGGIYVIEDIHSMHAEHVKAEAQRIADLHNLKMEWLDLRNIKGRVDDIMAIFHAEQ